MSTKQVQMEFQVQANDKISAQVTVTVGGVQKFSGALAHTVDVMPGKVLDDQTPYSLVEFDLDVEDTPNPLTQPNFRDWLWTTPIEVTIAVTGGDIALQATEANYTAQKVEDLPATTPPSYHPVTGTVDKFQLLWFATQPVWTPTAVGRMNIADNIDTGPGSLLLLDDESVSYQVAMTLYSAA
jgi:hypothetical protein